MAVLDGTARIWDIAAAKDIAELWVFDRVMESVAFSPDGSRIVTASGDKARIWDVHFATMPTQDLVAQSCTVWLRGLTKLTRDEMRLAGYPDNVSEIDVCAGIE